MVIRSAQTSRLTLPKKPPSPSAVTLTLTDIPSMALKIAKKITPGTVLALTGPLGAGKTAFTKALAKNLGVKHTVTSPTFVILNRYPAHLGKKAIYLYHLDLYRTKSWEEVKALGLEEFWKRPDTITVIEWADKIKKHLPTSCITLHFRHIS